jgi:hypothetical protein
MKTVVLAATAAATLALAAPAFASTPMASAQSVRLINYAGLSGAQVARFTSATRTTINGDLHAYWNTPAMQWTSNPNAPMTIVFYNRLGPVEALCGAGAAGCHGVLHGRPFAVVDTSFSDTGRIWSVAGSHELDEMWVDPHLAHHTTMTDGSGDSWIDEVADPVEDMTQWVGGVQVSDYVYPAWYLNTDGQQDAMNQIPAPPGTDIFTFSCPSGYAVYWNPYLGGARGMGPGSGGSGCTMRKGVNSIPTRSIQIKHRTAATADIRATQQGNRVAIFPIEK